MKEIKHTSLILTLLLTISQMMISCGKDLSMMDPSLLKKGDLAGAEGTAYLPTDLKSVTITVTQENGFGFIISSVQAKNKNDPTVEEGRINFNVEYETFSGDKTGLSLSTEIFSLVKNGFINQDFSNENFNLMMNPGIYILTVKVSKGSTTYPPFKAKMVVKCASTLQGNIFTADPTKVQIRPLAYLLNWPQKNRPVYLGVFEHDLSKVITSAPTGANTNLYTFDLDTNGDGVLEIVNGSKIAKVGYGLDLVGRNLPNPVSAYSTFADNERSVTYKIYDECFNSKAIEVSTGNNGIFGITEKEDLVSPDIMPSMSLIPLAPEDPSFMVYDKMSFLQQMHEQIGIGTNCGVRVGGVNYPQGCDTRLTGTLSLITGVPRSTVSCQLTNNSLSVKAEEILPGQADGFNYNLIDHYGVNMTINGIKTSGTGYPERDASGAYLSNYTMTVPGAGDHIGKEVLATNSCEIKVLLPEQNRSKSECADDPNKFTYTILQHVRIAYKCKEVKSTLGKIIKNSGELYCKNGTPSVRTDCKPVVNPPPGGTPGPTPVPTSPPPPTPKPQ